MRILKTIALAIAFALLPTSQHAYAQDDNDLHILAQFNDSYSDGENTPFWLVSRRQGVTSLETQNGFMRIAAKQGSNIGKSNFRYNAIADIFLNDNHSSNIFIQQANIDISWRWLTLSIGSKERFSEAKGNSRLFAATPFAENKVNRKFSNIYNAQLTELSSGGLIYSGNSRPIPQVRLEVAEYTPVYGTNNWLHARGHIAYGRFTDDNFQEEFSQGNDHTRYGKNILYHSKAAFIKIGKPEKFPLEFEGGVELYSQFGGESYTHKDGLFVSMPSNLSDYFKALIPLSGGSNTPTDEQTNISGNQIGSWHAALTLHTKPVDIRLYGEHMFEDFSQLFFIEYQSNKEGEKNLIHYPWKDMLLGITITNKSNFLKFISSVQYEYMGTYDQSGALYHDPSVNFNEQMDGIDNYYNHGLYPGWHHWGMGIGNPLIISPVYNKDKSLAFSSNRLISHNIGINGTFGKKHCAAYRIQYTYSENWGTYLNPLSKKGYTTSLLGEITFAPKGSNWAGSLSIGYDDSNFIGNNFGAMITLSRVYSIKL